MAKEFLIPDSDILLIVPPFTVTNWASLGLHILQACAQEAGFDVGIFYANLHFADFIGPETYWRLSNDQAFEALPGERIFAPTAYQVPIYPYEKDPALNTLLTELVSKIQQWVQDVATAVVQQNCTVVGATTMFDQTAAAIALLNHIKQQAPHCTTLIGGPNCENEMAQGIASLTTQIDYIFSGESEETFVHFLQQLKAGSPPPQRIIHGQPCHTLDDLPTSDLSHYYQQLHYYLPQVAANPATISIIYETSRGCWWGEKHHCTFCGLNGLGMGFRQKSPEKVIAELKQLMAQHPSDTHYRVQTADNIMPYTFFRTVLPKLTELVAEYPSLKLFYELKANLSLEQVIALVKAGVKHVQPGIEALSTSLLKRMDKGVTAAQNIALLRYARSTNMILHWNLLWGFPGDEKQEYEETIALLPLLRHLQPPEGMFKLSIDRFSPYFDNAPKYGITNLQPSMDLDKILPPDADVHQVAYHFSGDYESAAFADIELILQIDREVAHWQKAWKNVRTIGRWKIHLPPTLHVTRQEDGQYLLRDTRGLPHTQKEYVLSPQQVEAALVPRRYHPTPEIEWALAHKIGVIIDTHYYVPLATADPNLLARLEAKQHKQKRQNSSAASIPLTIATP